MAGPPVTLDASPTAGAPPAVPPTVGRPRSRWLLPAVVVGLVVVVVLATLVATGVILGTKQAGGPTFAPTLFGAAAEGQSTANAMPGGPWGVAFGIGLRLALAITVPTANITSLVPTTNGCAPTFSPGLPTEVVVSATPSGASPGTSAYWFVMYVNASEGAVGVMVNGGTATPVFVLEGAACADLLRDFVAFPSGSPDSPTIAAAVNAAGGRSFLSANPNATEILAGASVIFLQPLWGVVYTTCSPTPVANVSGVEFNASVVGTTVENVSTGPVSCALPAGLHLPTFVLPSGPSPAVGKAI